MNNLQKLTQVFVQSPWLDNLSRDLIDNGGLQAYVGQGVRGVTTNPTILENAIAKSDTSLFCYTFIDPNIILRH